MNTIAKNLIVERFRTGGREIAIDIDDGALRDQHDLVEDVVRRTESQALREALTGLSSTEQQTALRMLLHGLKPAEIAHEMGLSRNATDALLHRARRSLAARLEDAREALCLRGNLKQALELIDHGFALAKDDDERLQLLVEKARYLGEMADVTDATALLDRCESLSNDPRLTQAISIERAKIALSLHDLSSAHAFIDRVDFEQLSDPASYEAASFQTGLAATECRHDDAVAWATTAQQLADESGRPSRQLTARRRAALVLALSGRLREAAEHTRYVYDRYRQLAFRKGMLETGVNYMFMLQPTGGLLEGVAVGYELVALDPEPGWAAMVWANLADLQRERGLDGDAKRLATDVVNMPDAMHSWASVAAHLILASIALGEGEDALARHHAESARSGPALPEHRIAVETVLMEVAANAGDADAAVRHHRSAMALLDRTPEVLSATDERKLLMASHSDREVPEEGLQRLLTRSRRAGMRLEEARILLALATVAVDGRASRLAEAEAIFKETACGLGLREVQEHRSRLACS